MKALIESQQADAEGHVFPTTETEGSAIIRNAAVAASSSPNGGFSSPPTGASSSPNPAGGETGATVGATLPAPITLVADVGTFNVQTATCSSSCPNCCGFMNFAITPSNFSCPVGQAVQCSLQATNCNGVRTSLSASWSSSDTSIMTVNSTGLTTGVAPGTCTITAFASPPVAVSVTCPEFCPFGSPSVSTSGTTTPTVSISGPSSVPLRNGDSTNGVNSIQLTATGNPPGGTFSWATTSGNVTLSNSTSATVTVTSAAASASRGDTPVTVTYTVNSQNGTATQNMTVQQPSSLQIVTGTDNTTAEATCSAGSFGTGCGVKRTFKYQVLDQLGGTMQASGMAYWDTICNTSTNQLNLTGYMATCNSTQIGTTACWGTGPCISTHSTDASGQFTESLTDCSTLCISSGTCITFAGNNTVATQTWTVNGSALSGDVKTLNYSCTKILVNGN